MIDYLDRGTCGIIFSWVGSTLKVTWPDVLVATVVTVIANLLISKDVGNLKDELDWFTTDGHDLLTMPLAFLLVYRTGMSYNRFFEGRAHVGQMVHAVRELSRGVATYVKGDDPQTQQKRQNIARLIKAYTVAVRLSCRKIEGQEASLEELTMSLTGSEMKKLKGVKKNFPVLIIKWLGDAIAEFKAQLLFDRATDFLDGNLQSMMQAWMGMQKLATTPMPFPYVQMLYVLLYGWMWTCGFPLANKYGWISMVAVVLLGYTLFGINAIGQELEDPFGEEDNDLEIEFFEKGANAAAKLMLGDMLNPLSIEPNDDTITGGQQVTNPLLASIQMGSAAVGQVGMIDAATFAKDPQFETQVREDLKRCTGFAELRPELQALFKQYFDRYDLNHNGLLDQPKELLQLVTNITFALKLGPHLSLLLEKVEAEPEGFSWSVIQFTDWFLAQAKFI